MKKLIQLSVVFGVLLVTQSCKKPSACIDSLDWVEVNQPILLNSCSINEKDYEWSFGDGQKATSYSATHTYSTIGNYQVELKVSRGSKTNTIKKLIAVVGQNYKFIGTYNVVENCGFGNDYYSVQIEAVGDNQIKITNFLNQGWTIYGNVSGQNITLLPQVGLSAVGYIYDFDGGTATLNGNTITTTYTFDDVNYANIDGIVDCGATFTK